MTRTGPHCPSRATVYRALSADAATNYGLSPVLIVHDELGQVRGPRSELYEALETSTQCGGEYTGRLSRLPSSLARSRLARRQPRCSGPPSDGPLTFSASYRPTAPCSKGLAAAKRLIVGGLTLSSRAMSACVSP